MAVRSLIRLAAPPQKTVAQSVFMLTTVQPSCLALASDFSADAVQISSRDARGE